ncbi:hypothetical protein ACP70R_017062 [Stipagrostis hirtigluma subsp. patula]
MATGERAPGRDEEEQCRVALLNGDVKKEEWQVAAGGGEGDKLGRRVWEESKKLWVIVAPAIFSRVVTYGMNVITQAFAGHLGDLELAAISIANTVVVGFNFGLMVCGFTIIFPLLLITGSIRFLEAYVPPKECNRNQIRMFSSFGPRTPERWSLPPPTLPQSLGMASALETLCGQAFGAKKFHMMGVYMQRSWIVLFMCAVLLLPMYFFAEDVLLLTGQSPELSAMAGKVSVWFIPLHFSFAFLFPLQRFLQCQMKNFINAAASGAALCIHIFVSWLFITKYQFGLVGIALTLNFSWWATAAMLFAYVSCGGCPETWHGFSVEAFAGMWEFVKLSSASGVMLCGVAVGSGWQSMVAYVNIGSYYLIGIPLGILLGWIFNLGVLGIWAGMIGGTAVQTLILAIITIRCDWEKEAMIASTRMDKLSEVR